MSKQKSEFYVLHIPKPKPPVLLPWVINDEMRGLLDTLGIKPYEPTKKGSE